MRVPRSLQDGVGQRKQAQIASIWLQALAAMALGPPVIHVPAAIVQNALAHKLLQHLIKNCTIISVQLRRKPFSTDMASANGISVSRRYGWSAYTS